jgi:hypothetical protein
MGWLIAIIVFPILLAVAAIYVVLKLTMLMLRIVFLPVALLRR